MARPWQIIGILCMASLVACGARSRPHQGSQPRIPKPAETTALIQPAGASFHARVKSAISSCWRPERELGARLKAVNGERPTRHFTRVKIVLNPRGGLLDVSTLITSGLEEMDQLALKAVRCAAPFPNPDPRLLNPAGMIAFEFGFMLDAKERPTVRWGSDDHDDGAPNK
jgi:TonB family protein